MIDVRWAIYLWNNIDFQAFDAMRARRFEPQAKRSTLEET